MLAVVVVLVGWEEVDVVALTAVFAFIVVLYVADLILIVVIFDIAVVVGGLTERPGSPVFPFDGSSGAPETFTVCDLGGGMLGVTRV